VYRRREREQAGVYPRKPARIPPPGGPKEVPIALFVAHHQHSPEDCPARHGRGAGLLSHVSASTAARYGVTIYAEALITGQHVLLLVVEAASREAVARFLMSLPSPGELQILSAFSAEEAVERGGCGLTLPGRFVQAICPFLSVDLGLPVSVATEGTADGKASTSGGPQRRRRTRVEP
jgi:hypothetical protein